MVVAPYATDTTDWTTKMLRVRTLSKPGETVLVLEGRLVGPWVDELARCWARLRDQQDATPIRVDLDGVTFISAAGKALLGRLHFDGALLTARGCMTRAIIEEIAQENERGR